MVRLLGIILQERVEARSLLLGSVHRDVVA